MTMACDQQDELFELDERLVERVRQGSGASFATLVARHRDAVYRIARNMCATSSDAEEAIRQTFLSAYRDLGSLQTNGGFRTWLYGLAMKSALAGGKRAPPRPASRLEPLLPHFDQAGRLGASAGEWPDLERVKLAGVLHEALECMDDDVRAAFVLCDLAELPVDEAAAVLKTPPPAVRQRVHRARLLLRGFLERLLIPTSV
jgi:RNA polymerase sigma-70 factor (ECF subfamily)